MALFSIVYYLVLQTMRILKLLLWVLLGIFVVVLIISGMAFKMVIDFASYTDTTPKELYALVQRGLKHQPTLDNDRLNVLLLGLDYVEGRDDQSILTDSMMLLSLDAETGSVDTVAIPRDLWIDEYKTKVNALYYYGKQKDPEHPELFPKEVIEKITGIPIHHVYELRLNSLAAMIDAAGGIDIEVKKGFTDPLFPRSGIDVSTERDPEKLYETVSFEQGKEHMTGARALQYIRSRHSDDLEMGTDDARSMRQQEVVLSLISSMKQEIKIGNEVQVYNKGEAYVGCLVAFGKVTSIEYDKFCCEFASEKTGLEIINGSITELSFSDNSFDLVCAFDVIEHVEDDQLAVNELKRVTKKDALVLITVPAFMSLWSHHDVINHHYKRYKINEINQLFDSDNNGNKVFDTYFNSLLFLPIYFFRKVSNLLKLGQKRKGSGSDFEAFKPGVLNTILYKIMYFESGIINKKIKFPFGVSILYNWKKN